MHDAKLYILIAYPYFSNVAYKFFQENKRDDYELLVDSGAFTAYNSGKEVKLDDYCKFLDSIKPLGDLPAIQLDVIGNTKEGWQNYLTMKERGYKVLPVFHRGDDIEFLDRLWEESEHVCIAGIMRKTKWKPYAKWLLDKAGDRKSHWLAFVNMPFIKHYKPYSVDSSSWRAAMRYGMLSLPRSDGTFKIVPRKNFSQRPSQEILELLYRLGLTDAQIGLLRFEASWRGSYKIDFIPENSAVAVAGFADAVNAMAHIKRAFDVRKRIGTKIHLAIESGSLGIIFTAYDFLKKRDVL